MEQWKPCAAYRKRKMGLRDKNQKAQKLESKDVHRHYKETFVNWGSLRMAAHKTT